jgi:hypothetical protein
MNDGIGLAGVICCSYGLIAFGLGAALPRIVRHVKNYQRFVNLQKSERASIAGLADHRK